MEERKSTRAVEKEDALAGLVPFVCNEIRMLGEGAETRISDHVRQYYGAAGYDYRDLGGDVGWAWTKDDGGTYVLKADDQLAVMLLVMIEIRSEFRFDFGRQAGTPAAPPYSTPFVIRRAKVKAGSACIFEYRTTPSFGYDGMPGGYSIGVFDSGDVVRREFSFGDERPREETILATVPELAEAIQTIISRRSRELKSVPERLHNGTLDGSHDCFLFGDKRISARTIQRTDPREVRRENPRYYRKYKDNMKYENLVLDVCDEIAAEISRHGVDFRLKIR